MYLTDTLNGYINCLSDHVYFLNCSIQLKLILFYSITAVMNGLYFSNVHVTLIFLVVVMNNR